MIPAADGPSGPKHIRMDTPATSRSRSRDVGVDAGGAHAVEGAASSKCIGPSLVGSARGARAVQRRYRGRIGGAGGCLLIGAEKRRRQTCMPATRSRGRTLRGMNVVTPSACPAASAVGPLQTGARCSRPSRPAAGAGKRRDRRSPDRRERPRASQPSRPFASVDARRLGPSRAARRPPKPAR